MNLISTMKANTKEMKGFMLAGVQILVQNLWSMEGRHKRKKKCPICDNFSSFETW